MPPRKLKGAAKASYKRRASSRTPKPPSRLLEDAASPPPTNTVRREKRPKTVIELEDEDAPVDTISRFDGFQVFVLVTRQKNHRFPQAHWTVNPVKSWADQEQLLIDVALEELRHDHMVVEGVNKYSLKPNISWKVCRGRSRDAPWCRLRTEDDWEGFIDAVHTERNTPKVEWSAFILIETHYDPTRAASQFEGSSPLQGPAADDLDGFLAYVKTKVPEYIDFDCQTVRDAIIDNGVVLDDLRNIDPNGLPPVKHGWVRIMRKWWPVWKGIQREQQSKPRGPLGLEETPFEVYESQEFDESFDL
ncbi:hypothetical protein SAICODRAFT_8475 [Saitoella complicata NRRL Y-17804]|uniref:uncharacterized protein n=1 Tax=Saitoella complicata (strain BCRC 22490 / CBS 7301 / JCM 7358 / NBRC 10748 / NRRL Y-17804) TaxID=698492 RepID=UPI00086826F8|nr:uncharacterized protein SAICODRAFT_8475 [Saitoella complicata NRRL Y-17804]ODQ51889.1 hypothetical protein SAICODRAFT_8475 [Saitoella complicata NRRL Y-17804]